MPADFYSSDESSGGAPLHPALTTPCSGQQHSENKSDSPSDEEKALVQASANFGSLKDPFAETPGVPQSVPAVSYGGRPNAFHHQPTPSRMQNPNPMNCHVNFNHHSANRYRSSTFGNNASASRFRPGPNGPPYHNGKNGNNFSNEVPVCDSFEPALYHLIFVIYNLLLVESFVVSLSY